MQVILQGSLRHFPLGELLAFVAEHARSATLELEAKPVRVRLVVSDARLVWADSSHERDPMAILRDVAGWTAGTVRVLEDAVIPDGATPFSLELPPLLIELANIRREAVVFGDDATFTVSDDQLEQVTLNPDELKLLIGIGRGKPFGQLAENRDRAEATRTIRKLISLGIVGMPRENQPATQPRRIDLDATQPPKARKEKFELSGSLTSSGVDARAYVLVEDEQVIGRDESNAVALGDGSVSSRHARITRGDDGFYLEDLGSRNGTFLNGEKVTDRRLLSDNDVIRLGKVVLTFNVARELVRGRNTAPGISSS